MKGAFVAPLWLAVVSCGAALHEEGIRIDVAQTASGPTFTFRNCKSGEPIEYVTILYVTRRGGATCKVVLVEGSGRLGPMWEYGTIPDGYAGECPELKPGEYIVSASGAGMGDREFRVMETGEVIGGEGLCIRRRELK